jgi:hypothetical protein
MNLFGKIVINDSTFLMFVACYKNSEKFVMFCQCRHIEYSAHLTLCVVNLFCQSS